MVQIQFGFILKTVTFDEYLLAMIAIIVALQV